MVALRPDDTWQEIVFGLLVFGALIAAVVAVKRGVRPEHRRIVIGAFALVAIFYVLRIAVVGLGFVPGFLAASPFAAAGLAAGWETKVSRLVLGIAVLALPIVWLFEFNGGAIPQWGGRYVLASCLLATAAGVAAAASLDRRAVALIAVLSLTITAFGVAWLGQRSRDIDTVGRDLLALKEPALISSIGFFLREVGPRSLDQRWLSAGLPEDREAAVKVIEQAGIDEFAYLVDGDKPTLPEFPGWNLAGTRTYTWLDLPFTIATYDRAT
jgi:hypothetical protein